MVARPRIEGCRVIALNHAGQVLLVRHAYGSRAWMPPGGGVKPGEDPVLAGCREFEEEIGCRLEGARLLTVMCIPLHPYLVGQPHRIDAFAEAIEYIAGHEGVWQTTGREIAEARFFALDALPQDLASGLAERLPQWAMATPAP